MAEVPQEQQKRQRQSQLPPPVYFLSLEIENVLCFKFRQKLSLSDSKGFPAQWTVILGDNGAGKTTLLQCLAGMAETSVPAPVRNIDLEFAESLVQHDKQIEIHAIFASGSSLSQPTNPEQKSVIFSVQPDNSRNINHFQKYLRVSHSHEVLSEELPGLNCYGYGATRKMSGTSLSKTLGSGSSESLLTPNSELVNAEEWLLQADYAVARSTPTNRHKFKRRFSIIKEILKKLLPDVSDIRITSVSENVPSPSAEFLTPYGWVPLQKLSLGYTTVIAWTVDLAARLIECYPQSEDPLAEPAIVLVDEIDLHLHPKWQRTIMSFLTERLPNTQFIVTAHSPLVVQAAKNANLVLLRREEDHVVIDNDPEVIDNWRVDQVLTSVFELSTPHAAEIEPLIEQRRKLLGKSKLTAKDKRELKKLEEKIGRLPTAESPEDIRAMDIIRKAAQLLEQN
ncbi:AAA family ATPase [Acaryochloris sp. 'Moss Beach']|uniref:AAA family ATPase n=1 Tax=Acaryochloris sp. 'Moss Beach' TaxID=2740837 RepID=UPI001F235255|nr:AAA family ATPase [Acaryochloris sp. 'Moss Beach']UJB68322.1 AAA family ATPase [Acaryochloris sp. 'Moss Beach']